MSLAKPANKLTAKDWEKYPVWTFDLGNEGKAGRDETWMAPVKKLPATDIRDGGCRTVAQLACGEPVTLVLWNLDLNPERTLKLMAQYRVKPMTKAERNAYLSSCTPDFWIFANRKWWRSNWDGRAGLLKCLKRTLEEIFPIKYDISKLAVGADRIVRGEIPSPYDTV
jgi:hypothetical protein